MGSPHATIGCRFWVALRVPHLRFKGAVFLLQYFSPVSQQESRASKPTPALNSLHAAQNVLDQFHCPRPARRSTASILVGRGRYDPRARPKLVDRLSLRLVLSPHAANSCLTLALSQLFGTGTFFSAFSSLSLTIAVISCRIRSFTASMCFCKSGMTLCIASATTSGISRKSFCPVGVE